MTLRFYINTESPVSDYGAFTMPERSTRMAFDKQPAKATKSASKFTFPWVPSERQKEFFLSTARHVCYGGARGGGKSWAMRGKFVLLACAYEGLRLLLLRRTLPELEQNHIMPLQAELAGFAKYNAEKRMFTFPNGSYIICGYCDLESDVYRYQGQEYDVIGFEEATRFTEWQIRYLTTSSRSTRTDFKPRIYYTCNPGGPGHDYIKRLFIDRKFYENENPDDYVFIPAKVTDNVALMENNPEYVQNLKALPEHLRKAYLEGDWDAMEGQFFSEFVRSKHVIDPFPLDPSWRRFRAMDWGFNDPCCVLWFAVAPDKHIYVYKEIYQTKTLATDMAKLIQQMSGGEKIAYTVASPDAWQVRGLRDVYGGESIADTFSQLGVALMKADNSRLVGWQRVRENLRISDDDTPYIQIFSNCTNLIRTIPMLPMDKKDHEDVGDNCEDHAAEALRYGLMSRPSPIKAKKFKSDNKIIQFDPFYVPKKRADSFFGL